MTFIMLDGPDIETLSWQQQSAITLDSWTVQHNVHMYLKRQHLASMSYAYSNDISRRKVYAYFLNEV